ncbi:MAG: peptide chain release factor N(5)-glutamine methyltransferase [Phycisphaerales bacterium]|nr:peptide chain release factor N(5)-glutamine methyltransferase [Phycisphaerales bacterium]
MAQSSPTVWTTRTLLAWMTDAFKKKGLESPRLMGELLMAHVIGTDRLKLYTDADRPASNDEREKLRDLVARALKHEPVQYLVGEAWFFGMPLRVTRDVLIPRPCTELIIEHVLLQTRADPAFGGKTGDGVRFADICTGSGCIAIALAKNLTGASGIATDISPKAIEVAKANAERLKVADRLEFLQGDLCEPILNHPLGFSVSGGGRGDAVAGSEAIALTPGDEAGSFHFVVSNPPYIPDSEWNDPAQVDKNVRDFEPELALRGGPDGLSCIRPLIEHAPRLLRPGGQLMVETAAATARQVSKALGTHPLIDPATVRIIKDQDALDRLVIATRRREQSANL